MGFHIFWYHPDSKVYGANMGPTWGRQDPGGTHVGPMNFAIWEVIIWSLNQGWFVNTTLRISSQAISPYIPIKDPIWAPLRPYRGIIGAGGHSISAGIVAHTVHVGLVTFKHLCALSCAHVPYHHSLVTALKHNNDKCLLGSVLLQPTLKHNNDKCPLWSVLPQLTPS